ncbi:MAG: hypothetical protein R2719_04995 [Micropruina sp.]
MGPLAAGVLADALGMGAAFAIGAVILFAGAGAALWIPARLDTRGSATD